jgi:FixJ family two-component response regulator
MLDAVAAAIERDRERRKEQKILSELRSRFASLTPREQQLLALVTSGLMNKQIAAEIGLAEITVKIHRGSIMKKMGLGGIEWVILEVENPTKLGIAGRFCILAEPGIRHE